MCVSKKRNKFYVWKNSFTTFVYLHHCLSYCENTHLVLQLRLPYNFQTTSEVHSVVMTLLIKKQWNDIVNLSLRYVQKLFTQLGAIVSSDANWPIWLKCFCNQSLPFYTISQATYPILKATRPTCLLFYLFLFFIFLALNIKI